MTLKSVEKKYFLGDSAIFSLFWKITGNNRVFCCSVDTSNSEAPRIPASADQMARQPFMPRIHHRIIALALAVILLDIITNYHQLQIN